jgi:spore maturation protein SpmA
MLNYIWLTLLGLGILTALTLDINSSLTDKYKNNKPMQVTIDWQKGQYPVHAETKMYVSSQTFSSFYNLNLTLTPASSQPNIIEQKISLVYNEKNKYYSVYFLIDESAPAIWKEIAKSDGKDNDISGKLWIGKSINEKSREAYIVFEPVTLMKMKGITNAVIEYAAKAVTIAIGLIGIMALWLGMMKIADQAGLITIIAKSVKPVTRFLFPDVPHDHPAIGSMIMNMSANFLGLGNAATPFGLKAMEELDSLNPEKGTATNAMCTFLAINTAGLTLIPASAIAVRAALGSSNPAVIIGTSAFGAICATIIGVATAKVCEKFPMSLKDFIDYLIKRWKLFAGIFLIGFIILSASVTGIFSKIGTALGFINVETVKTIIQVISVLAIPFVIFFFITYGFIKKVKIYESFIDGAKEGFNVALRIIPFLVAMLVAIGIFRASGAMDFLIMIISPVTNLIGMPAEVLPMALMRPLSSSGSLGVMSEIMAAHGTDSFIGILTSTLYGSSETTFYVLALYFGSVNIKRVRHSGVAGIAADIAGVLGALYIVKLLFG